MQELWINIIKRKKLNIFLNISLIHNQLRLNLIFFDTNFDELIDVIQLLICYTFVVAMKTWTLVERFSNITRCDVMQKQSFLRKTLHLYFLQWFLNQLALFSHDGHRDLCISYNMQIGYVVFQGPVTILTAIFDCQINNYSMTEELLVWNNFLVFWQHKSVIFKKSSKIASSALVTAKP